MVKTAANERLVVPRTELVKRWDVSHRTLMRWASEGYGPTPHRMGSRVMYAADEVEEFERKVLKR